MGRILNYKKGSFIQHVRKIFRKTIISYPLICTRVCAYQGVRYVSFSENIAHILNKRSQMIKVGEQMKRTHTKILTKMNSKFFPEVCPEAFYLFVLSGFIYALFLLI